MVISLIVAMDRAGLIGDETGLPWHLPNDLRRFRACTWGKPIILGRKTFEFIGKPLPGRFNIVLTRKPQYSAPGCRIAQSFQEALLLAEDHLQSPVGQAFQPDGGLRQTGEPGLRGEEVMIIGGGKVYAEAISCWDRLYLTIVDGRFRGTTYFPVRELLQQDWRLACEPKTYSADEKNPHPHVFTILERLPRAEGPQRAAPQPMEQDPVRAGTSAESTLARRNLIALLGGMRNEG